MGKIKIDLEKIQEQLSEMDGFFRCYFEREFHDYHTTIKNLKTIIKREMETP